MKIAITGHTSGIGMALFNHFEQSGNFVIGFSRSNGYDISKVEDREKIIENTKDFDVFINNAYSNYDDSQLEMLKLAYESSFSCIINISSRYTKDENPYCETKKKLDDFCESKIYDNKYIMNVKPGLIDTPRVQNQTGKKNSTKHLVDLISILLNNRDIRIHSICFGVK